MWYRLRSTLWDEPTNFYWGRNDETQSGPEWVGPSHPAPAASLAAAQPEAVEGTQPAVPPWEGSQQELPALGFPWQPVTLFNKTQKPQAVIGTFLNLQSSLQVGLLQRWGQYERDSEEKEFMWRDNVQTSPQCHSPASSSSPTPQVSWTRGPMSKEVQKQAGGHPVLGPKQYRFPFFIQ